MGAGKIDVPQQFKQISEFGTKTLKQTNKPRKLLLKQLTEALATGGVGARIPIVQRAVEAVNIGTSQALKGGEEQMAKYGVGGPFAAKTLANIGTQGRLAASRVPTDLTQQFIQGTVPYLSSTQSLGMQGLQAGGQAQLSADSFNALQFKALMQDIKNSIAGAFGNTSPGSAGGGQL